MEEMMMMMAKREEGGGGPISRPPPPPPQSPLAMHSHSQTISKVKPKIRIIHIFAPEIIKTDVENFRELVQRLTGKPSAADKGCRVMKNNRGRGRGRGAGTAAGGRKKAAEFRGLETSERVNVKGEENVWGGDNSGGFLSGFGDFDGFMQELGEFPLLPVDHVSATDRFGGEAHLS